jgi:phospholipase B1
MMFKALICAYAIAYVQAKTYAEMAEEKGYTFELAKKNFAKSYAFRNFSDFEVEAGARAMFEATMPQEHREETATPVEAWKCPALPSREPGTTIADLHPSDIGAIGGIGDSISTGCNAKSTSIFNMKNYEGLSWIMGGDGFGTDKEVRTLSNSFQHYTGALPTLSYGTGEKMTGENWAKNGAISQDMVGQVAQLEQGFKTHLGSNYTKTWKFVNLLIGGNNLCAACESGDGSKNGAADAYLASVKLALDALEKFPRTFVAVSLLPDITQLQKYKSGLVCSVALWYACDCAASDDSKKRELVQKLVGEYNQDLTTMVNQYPDRDDWAVVLQPALQNAEISEKSLISEADCFHPSASGQAAFSVGLWNNLVEPAAKKTTWKIGDTLRCLTAEDRLTLDHSPAH